MSEVLRLVVIALCVLGCVGMLWCGFQLRNTRQIGCYTVAGFDFFTGTNNLQHFHGPLFFSWWGYCLCVIGSLLYVMKVRDEISRGLTPRHSDLT